MPFCLLSMPCKYGWNHVFSICWFSLTYILIKDDVPYVCFWWCFDDLKMPELRPYDAIWILISLMNRCLPLMTLIDDHTDAKWIQICLTETLFDDMLRWSLIDADIETYMLKCVFYLPYCLRFDIKHTYWDQNGKNVFKLALICLIRCLFRWIADILNDVCSYRDLVNVISKGCFDDDPKKYLMDANKMLNDSVCWIVFAFWWCTPCCLYWDLRCT